MKIKEVAICENCAGFGRIFATVRADNTCTVCEGSGRVIKITSISPFIPTVFDEE